MTTEISPATPATATSADLGTRFSAFTIDAVLLFGGQWVAFFVLSRQLQSVGLSSNEPCSSESDLICQGPSDLAWVLLTIFAILVTVGYHAAFEGLKGATPGKRWMGLEVRGVDGGRRIGLRRGAARSIVRQLIWFALFLVLEPTPLPSSLAPGLFVIIPIVPLAGLALAAVTPSGRGAHDWAASTVVVHRRETG